MRFLIVRDGATVEGDTFTDIVEALGQRRRFCPPASAAEALDMLASGLQKLMGTRIEAKGPDLEARCESVVRQAEEAGLLQSKDLAEADAVKPAEYFRCGTCGWSSPREADMGLVSDYHHQLPLPVGAQLPAGLCPECSALAFRVNPECGALAYRANADGTAFSTYGDLRDVLGELLEWAASRRATLGWECWKRAGTLFTGARRNKP